MSDIIGDVIGWIFTKLIINTFKGIGVLLRWSWFLGKRSLKEVWEDKNNGLVGVLTLVIGIGLAYLLISGSAA